ncbi:MAG TPA: radical SAM protein, partial [Pirellula sp.]|nr:radical SAM protein [Pirellula sp.]
MSTVSDQRTITLPKPQADMQLYSSVLADGFSRFPERKENYAKYRASTRSIHLDYRPIKLDIENVSRCNYHCTMCQVSDWPGFKRSRDMTFDEFKQILDFEFGLVEIKIQGMGEPFLGKCYIDMIQYARDRQIWVRSVTNGSILHHRNNYKKVIDADVCELIVSIDGASSETYEGIRRGGRFSRVRENCVLLNDYARSNGKQRTRMWVVVQDTNFHEIRDFPKIARELGFHRLTLSLDVHSWGQ